MKDRECVLSDEKIRELCERYLKDETLLVKDLAKENFIASSTMARYLHINGIKPRRTNAHRRGQYRRVVTPEQLEWMRYLYWDCHHTHKEIAEIMGEEFTVGIVRHIFLREGIPTRTCGQANTNKKLSRERREALARFANRAELQLLLSERRS